MKIPLEITFNNLPKDESVANLIQDKITKLEKICDFIISCRVTIDRPQQTGNPYKIVIILRLPPENEIVVKRESSHGNEQERLPVLVRDAFKALQRQLQEAVERMRGEVKVHPQQQVRAIVSKIFLEQGYGFLRTVDNREIYFHKNSVLHDGFEKLKPGTGVRFDEALGNDGPQATSVEILDKPGAVPAS